MIRGAVPSALAAAAALGPLNVLGTGGPSVVERAAAALQSSDDSILHYQFNATQQNADRTVATWKQRGVGEQRRHERALRRARRRDLHRDEPAALRGSDAQRHDRLQEQAHEAHRQLAGERGRLPREEGQHAPEGSRDSSGRRAPAAPARAGTAAGVLSRRASGRAPLGDPRAARLEARHRDGRVTVDGRDAIRLESLDGKKVYIVDAATYGPIEWTTTGNGGGVTLRFGAYEGLPVDAESMQLLSLQDQHPNAQVVRGASAYIAAESRLYPHG